MVYTDCLYPVSRHKPLAAAVPIVRVKVAVFVPLAQVVLSEVPPDRAFSRCVIVLHVAVAGVSVNNVSVGARALVLLVAAHFNQVNHFASSLPANPALNRRRPAGARLTLRYDALLTTTPPLMHACHSNVRPVLRCIIPIRT